MHCLREYGTRDLKTKTILNVFEHQTQKLKLICAH